MSWLPWVPLRRARPEPGEHGPSSATSGVVGITARVVVYKVISGMSAGGVTVITARSLGPDGRGAFVLLFTLATITYLLCTFGVNTGARVHLVAKPRVVEFGDYLGLSIAQVAFEAVTCALLGVVLLPIVNVELSAGGVVMLGLLGGSLLAQYMLFDAINAYGRNALAAALDAAGSVAQIVFVFGLGLLEVRDVVPYLAALTVANIGQVVVELVALRSMGLELRPSFGQREWRFLLRSGAPGTALSLAQMLTFRLDRYVVGIFLSPAAVGVYSVAAAIPELLRTPAFALSYSFFYRIASGMAQPDDFRALRRWFIALAIALSATTFLLAPTLIHILFGPTYQEAVTPLRILLLAEVGVTVFHLDAFSLAGLNRIGLAASAAVVGLLVVVLADLVLVPAFDIRGAAWGSVMGFSMMGLTASLLLTRSTRSHAVPG